MTQLPQGKTRLDLVREGLASGIGAIKRQGRLIVAIGKLIEDPHNERKTFRNMDGLVASIKAVGLVEPITVTVADDDRYQIITGHRRFRAAKAAGLEQVEVLIRETEDEHVRRQKSVISNVQREDVGPIEMAEGLRSFMDDDDRVTSQDDLADLIGKDKAWISGMLRVLTLPAGLKRKIAASELAISYDTMIRIARLDDPVQQEQLVDAVIQGATVREVRQHIAKIKIATGTGPRSSASKPKRVFHTTYKASVIVQATGARLTVDQCVMALKAAVQQALESALGEDED